LNLEADSQVDLSFTAHYIISCVFHRENEFRRNLHYMYNNAIRTTYSILSIFV